MSARLSKTISAVMLLIAVGVIIGTAVAFWLLLPSPATSLSSRITASRDPEFLKSFPFESIPLEQDRAELRLLAADRLLELDVTEADRWQAVQSKLEAYEALLKLDSKGSDPMAPVCMQSLEFSQLWFEADVPAIQQRALMIFFQSVSEALRHSVDISDLDRRFCLALEKSEAAPALMPEVISQAEATLLLWQQSGRQAGPLGAVIRWIVQHFADSGTRSAADWARDLDDQIWLDESQLQELMSHQPSATETLRDQLMEAIRRFLENSPTPTGIRSVLTVALFLEGRGFPDAAAQLNRQALERMADTGSPPKFHALEETARSSLRRWESRSQPVHFSAKSAFRGKPDFDSLDSNEPIVLVEVDQTETVVQFLRQMAGLRRYVPQGLQIVISGPPEIFAGMESLELQTPGIHFVGKLAQDNPGWAAPPFTPFISIFDREHKLIHTAVPLPILSALIEPLYFQ